MVSREIINEIIGKCGLKEKLRSFHEHMGDYFIEDVSLEPIEISETLTITDEKQIMREKRITKDKYKDSDGNPIYYGALENEQDFLQKNVTYAPEEFGSVNNYACNEYRLVNGYFYDTDYYNGRKSDNPNIQEWVDMRIRNLDSAIDKSPPLSHDTTFYRYGFFPQGMKVGDTGKFKGYTSMTYQEKTAERFKEGYYGGEEGRYKITIKAPHGTKGVLLNDTFEGVKEHEFLLGRNQRYMVLEVNDDTREVVIGLYSW